jgi:hypothetical protein
MLLVATSCLFTTVPLHAFYARSSAYHHIFLLVTVLSILFHTTQHSVLRKIDTVVAHMAYLFMLWESYNAIMAHQAWLVVFPLAVAVLWVLQRPFPAQQNKLHAGLHCVSIIGLHAFLGSKIQPN